MLHFLLFPTEFENDFFHVSVNVADVAVPEVTCHFLDGRVSFASCEINYGTDANFENLPNSMSSNGTNTATVRIQLTQLQRGTNYYYVVLAIGDSRRAQMQGNFSTGMC